MFTKSTGRLIFLSLSVFFVVGCVAISTRVDKAGDRAYKDTIGRVLVPAGEFLMGSAPKEGEGDEYPQHKVFLDKYYIDKYEVSNARYKRCVDSENCTLPHNIIFYEDPDYAAHPVVYVDWFQAKTFCEWEGSRLPTESEWEKAASWDDKSNDLMKKLNKYPWGNDTPDCSYANFGGCSGETKKVGSFEKGISPYGAYDMAGNVWEWVNDWYGEDYYKNSSSKNPIGPESGEHKVLRGGSWFYGPNFIRSTNRVGDNPNSAFDFRGFRCASSS